MKTVDRIGKQQIQATLTWGPWVKINATDATPKKHN